MSLLLECLSGYHVCAIGGRKTSDSYYWSYWWLWATTYVLGSEPGSSVRASGALNHWASLYYFICIFNVCEWCVNVCVFNSVEVRRQLWGDGTQVVRPVGPGPLLAKPCCCPPLPSIFLARILYSTDWLQAYEMHSYKSSLGQSITNRSAEG